MADFLIFFGQISGLKSKSSEWKLLLIDCSNVMTKLYASLMLHSEALSIYTVTPVHGNMPTKRRFNKQLS